MLEWRGREGGREREREREGEGGKEREREEERESQFIAIKSTKTVTNSSFKSNSVAK